MPLQYLQNDAGQTTAVLIPIEEWKAITNKYQDLKQFDQKMLITPEKKMQPSDLAGTLSEEGYHAMNEYIKQSRNDWDRDTF